jgi:DNA-binding CsgD family transcriptional regulator
VALRSGLSYFSPTITRRLLVAGEPQPRRALTPRQLEILRMIGGGLANKEIGFQLGLSAKTVAVHRARIMERLASPISRDWFCIACGKAWSMPRRCGRRRSRPRRRQGDLRLSSRWLAVCPVGEIGCARLG